MDSFATPSRARRPADQRAQHRSLDYPRVNPNTARGHRRLERLATWMRAGKVFVPRPATRPSPHLREAFCKIRDTAAASDDGRRLVGGVLSWPESGLPRSAGRRGPSGRVHRRSSILCQATRATCVRSENALAELATSHGAEASRSVAGSGHEFCHLPQVERLLKVRGSRDRLLARRISRPHRLAQFPSGTRVGVAPHVETAHNWSTRSRTPTCEHRAVGLPARGRAWSPGAASGRHVCSRAARTVRSRGSTVQVMIDIGHSTRAIECSRPLVHNADRPQPLRREA